MIHKEPYNNEMISIGNAMYYDGQQVYTDGKVALGWQYTPHGANLALLPQAGYWVGEQYSNKYKLAQKNLLLGRPLGAHRHGDVQAYPCYASIELTGGYLPEHGTIYTPAGAYDYHGAIVSLGSDGKALVYDNYALHFYVPGQQKQDDNGYNIFDGECRLFSYDEQSEIYTYLELARYYSIYDDNVYAYNDNFVLLATFDSDTEILTTYYVDGTVLYNGKGKVEIQGKIPVLEFTDTAIPLTVLRYIDGGSIWLYDEWSMASDVAGSDESSADIRKMFQLATALQCYAKVNTPDRDNQGRIIYSGDYVVHYEMVISTGYAETVTDGNNEIRLYDSNGDEIAYSILEHVYVVVNGSSTYAGKGSIVYNYDDQQQQYYYEIRLYIDGRSGTGNIEYSGNNTIVTDTNGNYIARENGTQLNVYYGYSMVWQGMGSITIRSATPTEYEGDYTIVRQGDTDITGHGRIVPNSGDTYVYDDTTGDIIAYTSGSTVYVYDSTGTVIWSGAGQINTSNLVAVKWFGTYELVAGISGNSNKIIFDSHKVGDYTVRRDIIGYSYDIRDPQGNISISTSYLSCTQNGNTITLQYGSINYQGTGWISLDNVELVDVDHQIYKGEFVIRWDVSGYGMIVDNAGDIYVYDEYTGDLLANESDDDVVVYDSNGNPTYEGAGYIDTSNIVDVIDNTYIYDAQDALIASEENNVVTVPLQQYQDTGKIVTSNTSINRSIKTYMIDATNGVRIQQYPATWQAGSNVVLNLADMSLEITTEQGSVDTYGQDPLGLLSTQHFVYPAGVHAHKDYVISQDSGLIWHGTDAQQQSADTATYAGIEDCFTLAWLRSRWR